MFGLFIQQPTNPGQKLFYPTVFSSVPPPAVNNDWSLIIETSTFAKFPDHISIVLRNSDKELVIQIVQKLNIYNDIEYFVQWRL